MLMFSNSYYDMIAEHGGIVEVDLSCMWETEVWNLPTTFYFEIEGLICVHPILDMWCVQLDDGESPNQHLIAKWDNIKKMEEINR